MENLFFLSNVVDDFRPFELAARDKAWLTERKSSTDPRMGQFLRIDISTDTYWELSRVTPEDITWNELEPAAKKSLAAEGKRATFLVEFRTHTLPTLLDFLKSVDAGSKVGFDEEMTMRFWPVSAQSHLLEHFRHRR